MEFQYEEDLLRGEAMNEQLACESDAIMALHEARGAFEVRPSTEV